MRIQSKLFTIAALAISLLLPPIAATAKKNVAEELFVYDPGGTYLQWLRNMPEIVLDHRNEIGYEVYGPPGTAEKLQNISIPYWHQSVPLDIAASYPSSAEVAATIRDIVARYSNIMSLESIGNSTNGNPLLVVKISDNPNQDEAEPEVKYISSMHGNEIAGRDVLLLFLEYIGQNYQNNTRIRELVDNTEIFIMPSMNPDGSDRRQRGNASYTDLNRDFPDFSTSDNENTTANREPETVAVMNYQASRQFSLSANYHGGAEVVNYPWDTISERHPFDALIRNISLEYATNVAYMRESTSFPNGITNGYDWYTLNGGMQDWSYHWHNDLQVTIEISGDKWPSYSRIPYYFETNRDAMLGYLAAVHQGAGFILEDAPTANGTVEVFERVGSQLESRGQYNFHSGEFYKVLPLGEYEMEIAVPNASGGTDRYHLTSRVTQSIDTENGNFARLRN